MQPMLSIYETYWKNFKNLSRIVNYVRRENDRLKKKQKSNWKYKNENNNALEWSSESVRSITIDAFD